MFFFFSSQLNNYYALKTQVEERWDLVTLLIMLLFFLVCVALLFALTRPEGVLRKSVALVVILPTAYIVANLLVQELAAEEIKHEACLELMDKIGFGEVGRSRCANSNPIKLEFIVPPWER